MNKLETSPISYLDIDDSEFAWVEKSYPELQLGDSFYKCPTCGKNRGDFVDGTVMLPIDPNDLSKGEVEWECNCRDQMLRAYHYLAAGIGVQYMYMDWPMITAKGSVLDDIMREYVEHIEDCLDIGMGMLLSGANYGIGKTTIAMLVMKEYVRLGARCYATTYQDLLSMEKAGWGDVEQAKRYRDKVDNSQVLLIDDLGKELLNASDYDSKMARQRFDALIRKRTQASRVTIITTNVPFAILEDTYGSAVYSLLHDTFRWYGMDGDDMRPNARRPLRGHRRIY